MSQNPATGMLRPNQPNPEGSTRLVIIALVAAVLAVILVNIYVEVAKSHAAGGTLVIYRANRALSPGDRLTARDVTPVEIPDRFADTFDRAVRRSRQTGNVEREGDILLRPIGMNDILTFDHFVDDPEEQLTAQILPGNRLIALPFLSENLPAIRPGMKVDIEAPFASGGPAPEVLAVLENVQVMAVGEQTIIEEGRSGTTARRSGNYKTISIQVNPIEATQISRIQKIIAGPFELHIRPAADESRPKIPGGGINPAVLRKIGEDPDRL